MNVLLDRGTTAAAAAVRLIRFNYGYFSSLSVETTGVSRCYIFIQ
ncbi:hypothetical protein [Chloroflexus sp. Y-396-1]|nr:hypothetical protein [Chloroflexus sp. Y-396-1]